MRFWASQLRSELCARAEKYGVAEKLEWYKSKGEPGVILFPETGNGLAHGNFHPRSFDAIKANPSWASRLTKSHSRRKRALPEPHDKTAKELDSCTSSDALLMNCFCHPGMVNREVATLLGIQPGVGPEFGAPGKVPLVSGATDATEVDMQIGLTNVEAKLTESDFTSRPFAQVKRYAGLDKVFDEQSLPGDGKHYFGYQLIRSVSAIANDVHRRFIVLVDGRRPDLLREWWSVHAAIHSPELRTRCGFVLWQETAAAAPADLLNFLSEKYGL